MATTFWAAPCPVQVRRAGFRARAPGAQAQGRDLATVMRGVSRLRPGHSLQSVAFLRALSAVRAHAAALDATDARRRREAVRRLRRANRVRDRYRQRQRA